VQTGSGCDIAGAPAERIDAHVSAINLHIDRAWRWGMQFLMGLGILINFR
jgi:hypothetical protein